jgi:hypothetical protein
MSRRILVVPGVRWKERRMVLGASAAVAIEPGGFPMIVGFEPQLNDPEQR